MFTVLSLLQCTRQQGIEGTCEGEDVAAKCRTQEDGCQAIACFLKEFYAATYHRPTHYIRIKITYVEISVNEHRRESSKHTE